MSEFTPRAKQVLVLAGKEARRFRQCHIDTEHLLLGILALNRGVVVYILQNVGFDIDNARIQVEEMMDPVTVKTVEFDAEEARVLLFDETDPAKAEKFDAPTEFSPLLHSAIAFAHEEAKKMGHSFTGTEHILLGLLREEKGVAAQVLKSRGMDLEQLRRDVLRELDPGLDSRSAALMSPIYLRNLETDVQQIRKDFSTKLDTLVAMLDSLKTEITQLRTDIPKGTT